MDYTCS